jgi:hypothetical protein
MEQKSYLGIEVMVNSLSSANGCGRHDKRSIIE